MKLFCEFVLFSLQCRGIAHDSGAISHVICIVILVLIVSASVSHSLMTVRLKALWTVEKP